MAIASPDAGKGDRRRRDGNIRASAGHVETRAREVTGNLFGHDASSQEENFCGLGPFSGSGNEAAQRTQDRGSGSRASGGKAGFTANPFSRAQSTGDHVFKDWPERARHARNTRGGGNLGSDLRITRNLRSKRGSHGEKVFCHCVALPMVTEAQIVHDPGLRPILSDRFERVPGGTSFRYEIDFRAVAGTEQHHLPHGAGEEIGQQLV